VPDSRDGDPTACGFAAVNLTRDPHTGTGGRRTGACFGITRIVEAGSTWANHSVDCGPAVNVVSNYSEVTVKLEVTADPTYGYTAHLRGVSFEEARSRITDALKEQGFGILTEIDVTATMKAKLNLDFRRYVILGACNPQLAHRALEAELGVGLLLPCNVCIWDEDGGAVVSIARPDAMFEIVENTALQPVAKEADERLRRALDQTKRERRK
jgi:uncharacterized protein (DUF302 family)